MSDHDDFAFEPIPGLPERPPVGEEVLWQGRPATWPLAREAFGLTWIAAYFAVLVIWRGSVGASVSGLTGALAYGLPYVGLGLLACLVVLALAWAQARTTVYTITSARVVMRIGAALSVTFNLPFTQIGSASLDLKPSGTGTIALQTPGDVRLAYLTLWPHVRPWHMKQTEPALRCIPDASAVARILAEAAETRLSQPVVSRTDAPRGASVVAAE
jgi:hypothetical protein